MRTMEAFTGEHFKKRQIFKKTWIRPTVTSGLNLWVNLNKMWRFLRNAENSSDFSEKRKYAA
jgi:hypothetical protein